MAERKRKTNTMADQADAENATITVHLPVQTNPMPSVVPVPLSVPSKK